MAHPFKRKPIGSWLLAVLALVSLTTWTGCRCGDPGSIDVSPCENPPAASQVTLDADLSMIRPLGSTIQLRVRGNRQSTETCIATGSQSSFLEIIEGTGTVNRNVGNLAHGLWQVEITALSGGDQAPVSVSKTLAAGANHTLRIEGNASGDLTAQFLN